MDLPQLLDLRLTAVLESSNEQRFYQNVHAYIHIIMNDEKGRSIIEKAEGEYTQKHGDIWRLRSEDDGVIDERARQTYKMERFNLFASNFVGLYVRIYIPIQDFVTSNEPIYRQDPIALIALYGTKSKLLDAWANEGMHMRSMPPKEARKGLKIYYRWFEGKREEYTNDLKQFHADFLTEYAKHANESQNTVTTAKPVSLSPIHLDLITGDFSFRGTTGNLNPSTQDFAVLKTLVTSPNLQATYLELIQSYRKYVKEVTKPEKSDLYKIIASLKKSLGITEEDENVFMNVKKVGYRLISKDENEIPD